MNQAQQEYVKFVQSKYPKVYKAAIEKVRGDMGDFDWSGMFGSFTKAVSDVAPQILQLKQQRDMLKLQTERAKRGQPPIDTQSYTAPLPYEATRDGAFSVDTTVAGIPLKWLLLGGAGLLVVFMLRK